MSSSFFFFINILQTSLKAPLVAHTLCPPLPARRLVASQVHCTLAKLLMLQFLPSPQICWLFCVNVCTCVCVCVCVACRPTISENKTQFPFKALKILFVVPSAKSIKIGYGSQRAR